MWFNLFVGFALMTGLGERRRLACTVAAAAMLLLQPGLAAPNTACFTPCCVHTAADQCAPADTCALHTHLGGARSRRDAAQAGGAERCAHGLALHGGGQWGQALSVFAGAVGDELASGLTGARRAALAARAARAARARALPAVATRGDAQCSHVAGAVRGDG